MRTRAVLAVMVVAGSCAFAPPDGAYEITPPAMWLEQYAAAEQCSGLQGDVSRVHWFLVPGNTFPDSKGRGLLVTGHWEQYGHGIYLAEGYRNYEWMVRHEALHEITNSEYHDPVLFGERCHALWGYLEGN